MTMQVLSDLFDQDVDEQEEMSPPRVHFLTRVTKRVLYQKPPCDFTLVASRLQSLPVLYVEDADLSANICHLLYHSSDSVLNRSSFSSHPTGLPLSLPFKILLHTHSFFYLHTTPPYF